MRSLRLAIVERLHQNLHESSAPFLDRLLLALTLLLLMCAPSSLSSTLTQALHPRRHPLAGVHGQPHFLLLLPLPQAQLSAVTASRTRS